MIFDAKMKLPKTVPGMFGATQGIHTGPETTAAPACDLLRDLLRLSTVAGALRIARVSSDPSTVNPQKSLKLLGNHDFSSKNETSRNDPRDV